MVRETIHHMPWAICHMRYVSGLTTSYTVFDVMIARPRLNTSYTFSPLGCEKGPFFGHFLAIVTDVLSLD